MEVLVRPFDELSRDELYDILKARNAVFIVEQDCPYQDIDDIDRRSLHIMTYEDKMVAYLRLYERDDGSVQIGRLLTTVRGKGYGRTILREGIDAAINMMGARRIVAEAQDYVKGLYESEGFRACSDVFLEDGIPHIVMIKDV
ncbi:MAG: GNAT family N-acetyltransferase [Candidatus Methanomethylophilaceae archaeon]|nr:GNAT family N-acetyltransferase [Candidatus Methanomethylophilaceae archaeon]